jgi:hypothetical protein
LTSSLSGIDGQAPCYPAFPQDVPIREDRRDGVNPSPAERATMHGTCTRPASQIVVWWS